jgi:hypothetical protein
MAYNISLSAGTSFY